MLKRIYDFFFGCDFETTCPRCGGNADCWFRGSADQFEEVKCECGFTSYTLIC